MDFDHKQCKRFQGMSAGFTLLELTVVIVVISVLFLFAYQRYLDLLVDVEKSSVEQTLGILRSAIGMKVAQVIVNGKIAELKNYEGSNPIKLLAEMPKNYRGERAGSDSFEGQGGLWYFNTTTGMLVYQVKNTQAFFNDSEARSRMRFQVQLVFEDNNHNGRFDHKIDDPAGLRLRQLDRYSWFKGE